MHNIELLTQIKNLISSSNNFGLIISCIFTLIGPIVVILIENKHKIKELELSIEEDDRKWIRDKKYELYKNIAKELGSIQIYINGKTGSLLNEEYAEIHTRLRKLVDDNKGDYYLICSNKIRNEIAYLERELYKLETDEELDFKNFNNRN